MKALVLALLVTMTSGCLMTRYLAQGAHGQLELLGRAEKIEDVIKDPATPTRTAMLLAAIPEIRKYGQTYGLNIKHNYKHYVLLGRPAAVWFVGAADPLAFKPLRWCFPIVGCFAGLGWFDEDEAVQQKLALEKKGYDAIVRPAGAYSTGGWFPDPVLSSMLSGGEDAYPSLANVILHESVHATVLVPDQPFFNRARERPPSATPRSLGSWSRSPVRARNAAVQTVLRVTSALDCTRWSSRSDSAVNRGRRALVPPIHACDHRELARIPRGTEPSSERCRQRASSARGARYPGR